MQSRNILFFVVILQFSIIYAARLELGSMKKKFLLHLLRNKRAILSDLCPKLGCQHGHCKEVNKKITCDCDRNWTGSLCQIQCPKDCGPEGRCVLGESGLPECSCPSVNSKCNVFVDRKLPKVLSLKSMKRGETKIINVAEVRESKFQYIASDCSDVGFYCQNGGTCYKHISVIDNKFRGLHCQCPDGFFGDLCQNRCTMKCENQGSCYKDRVSGKEMCICLWEFKGKYCEKRNDLFGFIKQI